MNVSRTTTRIRLDRGVLAWRGIAVCGALLQAVALAACHDTVSGPDLQNPMVVDGITYGVTEFSVAESFPVQIGGTVVLRNESGTTQSATFPDGCVVLMRAYDAQGDLAWDLGHVVDCTLALVEVELSPGESAEYRVGLVSAYTILGDDLPDGEYRIAVYLRPGGQTVEIDVGTVDLAVPRG